MKIISHDGTGFIEENLRILPGPGNGTIHIDRIKGEDYYIEFFNIEGKIIISCNYPSYMVSKTFDLSKYSDNEYTLRLSDNEGEGVGLYRIFKY